jgi:hypothetical protein
VESQLLKGHDYATAIIVLAICPDAATDDGIVWRIPSADGAAETHGA